MIHAQERWSLPGCMSSSTVLLHPLTKMGPPLYMVIWDTLIPREELILLPLESHEPIRHGSWTCNVEYARPRTYQLSLTILTRNNSSCTLPWLLWCGIRVMYMTHTFHQQTRHGWNTEGIVVISVKTKDSYKHYTWPKVAAARPNVWPTAHYTLTLQHNVY